LRSDQLVCQASPDAKKRQGESAARIEIATTSRGVEAPPRGHIASFEGAPVKFIQIERTLPVINANSKYAKKAARRSVTEVVEWVSRCCIVNIRKYSRYDLFLKASDTYANGHGIPVPTDAEPAFYDRIEVNFLRHEESNYDRVMNELNGQIGIDEGRLQLRYIIFLRIAVIYPHLHNECVRKWNEALDRYYCPRS
jgi:hypothetical protein